MDKVYTEITDGYSCADINAYVKEAAMAPVRELSSEQLMNMKDKDDLRGITIDDFINARKVIAPSVSTATLDEFNAW